MTITEHFSKFNGYNAHNDVIDDKKSNLQACSFKKRSVIALKISLVVFKIKIANPSNGVRGRVGPPLIT